MRLSFQVSFKNKLKHFYLKINLNIVAVNIQQLTDYLLQHKTLSMEKIGTISINNPVEASESGEQAGPNIFVFDKKAATSEGLYAYIAELQQKNPSIVRADVDSFIEESRQLMNIGSRAMHFQGVGYIYSDKNQGYKLSKYSPVGFRETLPAGTGEDNSLNKMPNYNYRYQRSNNGMKVFLYFIILVLLAGIGYFIYSMMHERAANAIEEQPIAHSETVQDTVAGQAPVAKNNVSKFIIETTPHINRVTSRTAQLTKYGHNILVDTVDINGAKSYKIYFPITLQNPADTSKIKDSLSRYFGRKVVME